MDQAWVRDHEYGPTAVVLKVGFLDQQQQPSYGTCWKFRFLGPNLDLLNPKLREWGPSLQEIVVHVPA